LVANFIDMFVFICVQIYPKPLALTSIKAFNI